MHHLCVSGIHEYHYVYSVIIQRASDQIWMSQYREEYTVHLLLNFGHAVTQSLLLNNTSYYGQSLWEADNDLYGQQIPYFSETHRFNAMIRQWFVWSIHGWT